MKIDGFKTQQVRDIVKLTYPYPNKSPNVRAAERDRNGLTLNQWIGRMSHNLARLAKLNESKEFQELLKKIENGKLPF